MMGRTPRNGLRLAAALIAALAAIATTAGIASARPSSIRPTTSAVWNQSAPLSQFARNTTFPFETEYDAAGYYGPVKCKGKHQTNARNGYPGTAPGITPAEGGRDVERCGSTTGKPLVGLIPGETVALGGWFPGSSGWDSDYDGQAATAIEYRVSANGKAFKLVAYYPFAG